MTSDASARVRRAIDAMAARAAPRDAVPTGFPSVDNALAGGLRRGDLVVLAGEVGSGKSALTLAMALRASDSGANVQLMSGEMEPARLAERALAIEARVRVDDLRRGTIDDESRARLVATAERIERQLPTFTAAEPGGAAGVGDRAAQATGTDLLIVDPLQALASGAQPLDEELAGVARILKRIAVEQHVCVLVTTHLPSMPRERKDPRPQLDDLGALGALKQFSDVVLGLYRHEMYEAAPDVDGATELIVLKNRNGARGYVDLYFYKQWMRFEDMLEPDR